MFSMVTSLITFYCFLDHYDKVEIVCVKIVMSVARVSYVAHHIDVIFQL